MHPTEFPADKGFDTPPAAGSYYREIAAAAIPADYSIVRVPPMNMLPVCPGPSSRRSFLQAGAVGLSGLGLADLLRLQAHAESTTAPKGIDNDHSVIFVWLPGGPPHMETYDMKPDAPEDYRGEFRPIHTNVAGID